MMTVPKMVSNCFINAYKYHTIFMYKEEPILKVGYMPNTILK